MKLNINSNTAQLYRWFYSTSVMPESLCPYFWKLALMWVFIIPYVILSLPMIIMERLDRSETHSTGGRLGGGLVIYVILSILICMLSWIGLFFVEPVKDSLFMHALVTGAVGWSCLIIIAINELYKVSLEKWKNRGIKYDEDGYRIWNPEPKQDSIIVSFVKASYNKYCPRIEWNNNK